MTGMRTLIMRSGLVGTAVALGAITAASPGGSAALAAAYPARLSWTATMSNAHPADYTTTDVRVQTALTHA